MNNIMSYFCFLSVQTVNFCGHIARYAHLSVNIFPSKQIQKSDSGNYQNPPIMFYGVQSYDFFFKRPKLLPLLKKYASQAPNPIPDKNKILSYFFGYLKKLL